MASSDEENLPTPENVAKIATERANLDRVALIGVFGSESNPGALIRDNDGSIARVSVGDAFDGSTVAAIGADSLILSRGGKTKVMKLPRA